MPSNAFWTQSALDYCLYYECSYWHRGGGIGHQLLFILVIVPGQTMSSAHIEYPSMAQAYKFHYKAMFQK